MKEGLQINTILCPLLFEKYADNHSIVVVIDILRATSVISTAFHFGVKEVLPVLSLNEARKYIGKNQHIVAAERNAMPIEGFEYGNSPFHYMNQQVKDKTLVLTTTNGTKALQQAADQTCITACFINFDAVVKFLLQQQRSVLLYCAGWKGFVNLEDSIFAGKIARSLLEHQFTTMDDSTVMATHLFDKSIGTDLFSFLNNSSHRHRLKSLNMEDDTRFCLNPTFSSNIVPILKNGKLVSS